MFENSLRGACCYKLCNFGERHDLFSHYGRIKANSAAKELNGPNRNTKGGSQNLQITYHYIPYFFNCKNDLRLDAAIILIIFCSHLQL